MTGKKLMRSLTAIALLVMTLSAGVIVGWGLSRKALPIVPYSAPVISSGAEWPAGFYVRFADEYRFYVLAEPAEGGAEE